MSIRRILWLIFVVITIAFCGVYLWTNSSNAHKLAVRPIGTSGIYVGAQSKSFIETRNHDDVVRGLHEGEALIRAGNEFYKKGKYDEAVVAYKKAHAIDPGGRLFASEKLIKVYEETGQYDKALAVVDEIMKTEHLSQYGIDHYTATRARLLAAISSTEPHSESVASASK